MGYESLKSSISLPALLPLLGISTAPVMSPWGLLVQKKLTLAWTVVLLVVSASQIQTHWFCHDFGLLSVWIICISW